MSVRWLQDHQFSCSSLIIVMICACANDSPIDRACVGSVHTSGGVSLLFLRIVAREKWLAIVQKRLRLLVSRLSNS